MPDAPGPRTAEAIVQEWDDQTRGTGLPWDQQKAILVARIAAALAAEREACCQDVCLLCWPRARDYGVGPAVVIEGGKWVHTFDGGRGRGYAECCAQYIRARGAREARA